MSWGRLKLEVCLVLVAGIGSARIAGAEARVHLEVALESGFIPTDAARWSQLLDASGFSSVRIRSGRTGETPTIEASGTGEATTYRVVGLLSASNQLTLKNGRFGLSDRGRIEEWLRKLRDNGEEGVTIKPAAFGLLPRQLLAVHKALRAPVTVATKGKQPREAAKQIAVNLKVPFTTDPAGQRALAADEPVGDELQGLSSGTALAALLRPLGLALVPEKSGADWRLRIALSQGLQESWPVGWPPQRGPQETLPELFKTVNVEIEATPVADVLAAVGSRVRAPILLDRNALAAARVDIATANVALPATKTYYDRILDQLLFQAELKYELRVDEADKPLLWITANR